MKAFLVAIIDAIIPHRRVARLNLERARAWRRELDLARTFRQPPPAPPNRIGLA